MTYLFHTIYIFIKTEDVSSNFGTMRLGRIAETPIGMYYIDIGKYTTRKIHRKLHPGRS